MKVRTFFLLFVLVAITAFAVLNWSAFMTQTTLSLGVAHVQASLGLVMLGMLAFLVALFLVFVVYLQTSVLFDTRRNARELQASRELADQAEASRFTELREFMKIELKKQADRDGESRAAVLARLDLLERDLRSRVEQSENTISAYIGELDDRLERTAQGQTVQPPA